MSELQEYAMNQLINEQMQVIKYYQELAKNDCRNSQYSKTLIDLTITLRCLLELKSNFSEIKSKEST